MRKPILCSILFLLLCITFLQAQHRSIMQEQSEYYHQFTLQKETQWDSLRHYFPRTVSPALKSSACTLSKRVFGWHPYWVGTAYTNYQWNLLSDLCYFDYSVTPTTGQNSNTSFAWSTSTAVTNAISNGVNASFCVTLFSGHSTFLGSSASKTTLINNIISLLNSRGGKGVNIDFEGMASTDKVPFSNFMIQLSNALHAANPNYELSIALYAVDWNAVFDIPTLNPYVDLFIIMGYDYYWSGSTTAGPEDPLYNFETTYNYTLSKSITYYLHQGVSLNKLLLGLPYYGREWPTAGNTAPSATSGTGGTVQYNTLRQNTSGHYGTMRWEGNSFSPYFPYQVGTQWWQCFMDNDYSIGKRYDIVNQRGIGGTGIWALGYDDGYTELWNKIRDKLSSCAIVPCTDTIYDMGGPTRNYYDNENYAYTISPAGATTVSLTFSGFDVEANYDSLFIYNGPSIASPVIGTYTGLNSPGTVSSTGPSMTMRFKSDGATNRPGFQAIWQCQVATGIHEQEPAAELLAYPNPCSTEVTVSWNLSQDSPVQLKLFDLSGRSLTLLRENKQPSGKHILILNTRDLNLSKGMYFLELFTGISPHCLKLIID